MRECAHHRHKYVNGGIGHFESKIDLKPLTIIKVYVFVGYYSSAQHSYTIVNDMEMGA